MSDYIQGDIGQYVPSPVRMLHDNIMKALNKHYPSWKDGWHITIDTGGGIVQIRNLLISGDMGWQAPIADLDTEMRVVVMAAGEILERYRIARGRARDIIGVLNNLERNGLRQAAYDQ